MVEKGKAERNVGLDESVTEARVNSGAVPDDAAQEGAKEIHARASSVATAGAGAERGAGVLECLIRIGGVDFNLVPASRGANQEERGGGAARGSHRTARRLWEARREAGLTQLQLARRLGKSQTMVSQAESATIRVGERYVKAVLEACELPGSWGMAEQPSSGGEEGADELDLRDVAGLDPETCLLVRRGTERDLELGRKYVWWDNFRNSEN